MPQNEDLKSPPPGVSEPDTRDLGFGSVVSQAQRTRLLNRDGTFNVRRRGLHFWTQLNSYHALLTMRWWKFNALLAVSYLFINLAFAVGYLACGPGALRGDNGNGSFAQAFFFSVETFSTIGFGNIVPSTHLAATLVVVEAFVGLTSVAIATGLLFARFSRPTAEIVYSRIGVIAPYFNKTGFMFRITNARQNQIIDLTARVIMSRFEQIDGRMQRRYHQLKLERDTVAFFPLAWTIVHPIDHDSPIYGWDQAMMDAAATEFLVLLTGLDETFAQQVHSRTSYTAQDVRWNAKFVSMYEDDGANVAIDVGRLNDVEPVAPPAERRSIQ